MSTYPCKSINFHVQISKNWHKNRCSFDARSPWGDQWEPRRPGRFQSSRGFGSVWVTLPWDILYICVNSTYFIKQVSLNRCFGCMKLQSRAWGKFWCGYYPENGEIGDGGRCGRGEFVSRLADKCRHTGIKLSPTVDWAAVTTLPSRACIQKVFRLKCKICVGVA